MANISEDERWIRQELQKLGRFGGKKKRKELLRDLAAEQRKNDKTISADPLRGDYRSLTAFAKGGITFKRKSYY